MDAAAWDQHYADHDHVWGVEPTLFVRQQCERLPVGAAVDLACGEGRNAVWLARLGWQVTGIDFSAVAIARAREITAQQAPLHAMRLAWRVEDLNQVQLKPASLDLALMSYVHLPPSERDEICARAAQALRPRGHLVIVGHHRPNPPGEAVEPQDEDLIWEPDPIRRLLSESCGLTVEVARVAERPTPHGMALDTVVRARRD